ncbi:MAG: glycosyltransferase family 39 protein [Anaerolineae bacterium]|nr:glycosyltransferase family 39 protein [Anaerolineae bacterium]
MTKGRRAAALLLLAAALGLATLGQFYFFRRRAFLWDGVVFDALAVLCFLLAWRQLSPRTAAVRLGRLRVEPARWPVPAILLAAGLLFAFVAALLSGGRYWDQTTTDAVVLWLIGIACAATAALWPATAGRPPWVVAATSPPGDPGTGQKTPITVLRGRLHWLRHLSCDTWLEIATVAALAFLAFLLRATALDSVPSTLGGDEAWHGLLARQVLRGEMRNPFIMGYMSMPTFFYWPLGWSLWLVGDGMIGLRLPAALAGTITVPLFYGLVRSLWGRRTALLSALFLVTYDYHIHYSRLGANNIWDPLFAVLIFWAVDRGLARSQEGTALFRSRPLILAGLVLGLAYYFYTGARLLPILVIVYGTFVWLQRRRAGSASFGDLIRLLAVIGVALVIVAGPILSIALTHPDDWNARLNQIGIIQSGWLAREPELTGKSTAQILAEQALRSAGAFHVYTDRTAWYGADRPLLGFLDGILALLGMAWVAAHWRERRYFLVLIWFWGVIFTGGVLTEGPPNSQRLVMSIPAVCLLVVAGLEAVVGLARRLLGARPIAEKLILGLLITALAVGNLHYYFVTFTSSHRYGSANGETATMIGHYLRSQAPGTQVYFLGAPRIYWGFGTMGFLAPQVHGHDIEQPLIGPPDLPDMSQSVVFVFLPDRAGELQWVQAAFPSGQAREFYDDRERLRFIAYEASP